MKHLAFTLCLIAAPALAQQGQPGQHFVDNWDLDRDGAVTAEEAAQHRDDVFYMFDANEDGFLDAEEYVSFDEARANDMAAHGGGQGRGAMQRAADGMRLEVNDNDADGRVSLEEFVGNAAAWIESMDRDGDGVVTTSDFGPARG